MTLTVPASQRIFGVVHFAVGFDVPDKLDAVCRINVQARGIAHRVQLLRRIEAQHLHEGGIDRQEPPLAAGLVHAFHDVFEQAAEFRLTGAQRVFRAASLDRDAGELRHARHELQLASPGRASLAPIDREAAERTAVDRQDRRRPTGLEAEAQGKITALLPQRILGNVCDNYLTAEKYRGGAGAKARAHRSAFHAGAELGGQAGRYQLLEGVGLLIEQADRAVRLGATFSMTSVIASSATDRCACEAIFSNTRRSPAAISSARLRSVMSVMLPRISLRVELGSRTSRTSRWNVVAERITVQPFEHRSFTIQRALQITARHPERRRAVGLCGWAHLFWAALKQRRAIHLEEAHRIVVDVDEAADVYVEHHDGFRSVFDQRPVARFAFAHGLLGIAPIRDVTQADDEDATAVHARLAHRDVRGKRRAILVPTPGLVGRQIDMGVIEPRREPRQVVGHRSLLRRLGHEMIERAADDLCLAVAEDALSGGIESLDVPTLIDRDDGVLNVIENGLQLGRRLLANFAREGLRLIRHELHRTHDAAALLIDRVVVAADGMEQLSEFGCPSGRARSSDAQLLAKQSVKVGCAGGELSRPAGGVGSFGISARRLREPIRRSCSSSRI